MKSLVPPGTPAAVGMLAEGSEAAALLSFLSTVDVLGLVAGECVLQSKSIMNLLVAVNCSHGSR